MEGWQKGAGAVLKMSGAGKENYFKNFPERKEWFQSNFPEHFGRSVAAATTSLKKVTKAKQQKQRLAIIRQVAEKQNRLKVSSDAVRAMGDRRRESGEGLGGGLETNRDIIAHATAGNYIKSGGLGSLFEEQSLSVDKKEDGYYVGSQGPFKSRADAEAVLKASQLKLPPDRSTNFRYTDGASVDQTTPPPEEETDLSTSIADWLEKLEKQQLKGADWPKPGAQGENKRWGKVLGQVDTEGNEIGWMDQGRQYDILRTPPDDTRIDTRDPSRRPVEKIAQQAGYYYPIKEENIEECMPMPGDNKWDYLDTWEKNPIKKGSTSSEADEEPGEYDYEGDMAKSQLRSIMHNSKMLHDLLEDNTNLPEWVQSKITLAEDYILTAANYMRGEMDRMDEEVEQVDEAKLNQVATFVPLKKHIENKSLRNAIHIPVNFVHGDKSHKEKLVKKVGAEKAAMYNLHGVFPRKLGEEAEQVDEANMRFDPEAAARPKSSDVKNFLNRDKNARAGAASKKYIRRMTKLGGLGPNQTKKDTEKHMKDYFEEVEISEASKEGKSVMYGMRASMKAMDLRHGVDSDKRDSGYKMSPAVRAAQAKSDALSKVEKPVQAGTLAALKRRAMKKEEVESVDEGVISAVKNAQAKWKTAHRAVYGKDPSLKSMTVGAIARLAGAKASTARAVGAAVGGKPVSAQQQAAAKARAGKVGMAKMRNEEKHEGDDVNANVKGKKAAEKMTKKAAEVRKAKIQGSVNKINMEPTIDLNKKAEK